MRCEHQGWGIIRRAALCAVLLIVALLRPTTVHAAGVVGTGTPGSCTEAALDAALVGGGLVTFDCGPDPVTITITSAKTIAADASIDGGSLITISGGNSVRIFSINRAAMALVAVSRPGSRNRSLRGAQPGSRCR